MDIGYEIILLSFQKHHTYPSNRVDERNIYIRLAYIFHHTVNKNRKKST